MNEFVDSGNPFSSFPFPLVSCYFVQKITFILRKIHKNCCHQSSSFWLKYAPNRLSAGALPQTSLGELTALPQTS